MEKLTLCRICLVENVRMHVVADSHLQEIFEKLTNIPFITEDSRPMLACFFCYARLKQCYKFRQKCLEAEAVFTQMLDLEYEQKTIQTELEFFGGFIKTSVQHYVVEDLDEREHKDDIKKEQSTTGCERISNVELKVEHHSDEFEQETKDDSYAGFEDSPHTQSDSEDDIPLTRMRTRVEQVKKKRKATQQDKEERKKKLEADAHEIRLSKKQQMEDLIARSNSSNYANSPYKCGLCYKGFIDLNAFDNHKIKHDERSGPHVCDICQMHYRTVQHLRTHATNAHARLFKCNKCGLTCHTSNQARVHDKWHKGHLYECQLCGETFKKPTSYLSHMRKRHPTEHICNICGESFVGKHGLQMHKKKTHISDAQEEPDDPDNPASDRFCGDCNIQFYNLEAWKRHILCSINHTLKTEQSTHCSICSIPFGDNVSKANHMKEHAKILRRRSKKPYAGKLTTTTKSNAPLRCTQCGDMFASRSKLHAHFNSSHLGIKYNKNVVCEVCGKICTSNAALKYHQRTHTGEKPYSCKSCSKHFTDSNQLRIHTRTHTGERPYVCAACGKSFSQKPALNRHYRVHTGVKPYTCQYCSRTFSQSNSLKLHVKTVHLKQPVKSRKKTANITQETKTEKIEELQTE